MKKVFPILAISLLAASPVAAMPVKVTIENLAPAKGNYFTPVWLGFHDGSFDIYDAGGFASPAVQRLAEDGNAAPLDNVFQVSTTNGISGVISSSNIRFAPGDVATSGVFDLDPVDNQYFSYLSMIIPSNDAFIGNDNPAAYQIFSNNGTFQGLDLFILGNSSVMDAGSEVNDEIPVNTAFLGQTVPDTGVTEKMPIQLHAGFNPKGSGGILDNQMFDNADFTRNGYPLAQIRVEYAGDMKPLATPIPGAVWLFGSALFCLAGLKSKKK